MAAKTKIVNEKEVLGWFRDGKPYWWMVETYLSKYGIETTVSMWGNFRSRKLRELPEHEIEEYNLDRRTTQNDELVPWKVAEEHRYDYPVVMLRMESRRRAGEEISKYNLGRVTRYMQKLRENGLVVAYDPETGFTEVPRESGDADIVRRPLRGTGKRRAVS